MDVHVAVRRHSTRAERITITTCVECLSSGCRACRDERRSRRAGYPGERRCDEVCFVILCQSRQYHIIVGTNYLQGLCMTEMGITGSIIASLVGDVVNRSAVVLSETECSNHTAHATSCRYMPRDSPTLCVGLRWVTFRSDHLPSMHQSTICRPRHICNRLPRRTPSPKRSERPIRVQASSRCVL